MDIVKINKIDTEACGVAKLEDRTILVERTLPDEEVEILSKEQKNKYDIAVGYKVLKFSEARVKAPCSYYEICGGCSLQHANCNFQKSFKIDKVEKALKHISNLNVKISEFVDSDKKLGYRNKIVFAVKDFLCGMYEDSSNTFHEIGECLLISQSLNGVYQIVANWVKNYKIDINHLALREIKDKYSIVLIGEKKPNIDSLVKFLDKIIKDKYQIVFNRNSAYKDLITNNLEHLYGIDIEDYNFGIVYPVSANTFLQVNKEVSDKLYLEVQHRIENEVVINAYSGAGLLSAILSKKSKKVYGVEVVRNAHLNAEKLKRKNNLTNLTNICGKSETEVPKLLKKHDSITLVLDPPRKGVDPKLLNLINNSKNIDKIVYISCSPNSLAKNLRELHNFEIKDIKLFDMFPQTSHVETLVCLQRQELR